MDGTIPTAIGQWALDATTTLLAYPGPFGWGVLSGVFGPAAVRWIGKKLPGKKR